VECKVDLNLEIGKALAARFSPTVLSGTISEMEAVLRQSRGKKRKNQLTLALNVAKRFNRLDYTPLGEKEMDDVILRAATELRAIVATDDGELRKRLVKAGTPVLFIREKSHIEADGWLDGSVNPLPNSSDHYQYQRD
jgi:rRNA-processing protein FCF1